MTIGDMRAQRFALIAIAFVILLFAIPVRAQQAVAPESSASQSPQADDKTTGDQAIEGQGQNTVNKDRLFGVLPNYSTVENEHQFGKLSSKDKFKLTADSMFDPVTF